MPAVSTNTIGPSGVSTKVSMESRRAGHVVDHRSISADETVEQGAFADVGTADDQ
jgi:hypothetical protein